MSLWAIAYTKYGNGHDRVEPYIFPDTVRLLRKDAWIAWGGGFTDLVNARLRRRYGAVAIKVRLEVVA